MGFAKVAAGALLLAVVGAVLFWDGTFGQEKCDFFLERWVTNRNVCAPESEQVADQQEDTLPLPPQKAPGQVEDQDTVSEFEVEEPSPTPAPTPRASTPTKQTTAPKVSTEVASTVESGVNHKASVVTVAVQDTSGRGAVIARVNRILQKVAAQRPVNPAARAELVRDSIINIPVRFQDAEQQKGYDAWVATLRTNLPTLVADMTNLSRHLNQIDEVLAPTERGKCPKDKCPPPTVVAAPRTVCVMRNGVEMMVPATERLATDQPCGQRQIAYCVPAAVVAAYPQSFTGTLTLTTDRRRTNPADWGRNLAHLWRLTPEQLSRVVWTPGRDTYINAEDYAEFRRQVETEWPTHAKFILDNNICPFDVRDLSWGGTGSGLVLHRVPGWENFGYITSTETNAWPKRRVQ